MVCNAVTAARTKQFLVDDTAIANDKCRAWLMFNAEAAPGINGPLPEYGDALSILAHPSYQPPSPSYIIYQPHVPTTTGTASYNDVIFLLDQVLRYMQDLQICLFLLGGDQQTFSRMLWLRRMNPGKYDQIVPFVGDFHGAVHMLMAIHILW